MPLSFGMTHAFGAGFVSPSRPGTALRPSLPAGAVSDRLRRITKEIATLPGQLPLAWESGVLLAMDEDRMDVLRASIGWVAVALHCSAIGFGWFAVGSGER